MLVFTIPDSDLAEYRQVLQHSAPAGRKIDLWLGTLKRVEEVRSTGQSVTDAARAVASAIRGSGKALRGFSADNIRNKYYDFVKDGWRCLIDLALMPKEHGLPVEFRNWWLNHLKDFKVSQPGKAAHRAFLQKWKAGECLPGIGTWQQWYVKCFPGRVMPPSCPWSVSFEPPSLSYRNVKRLKLGRTAEALTRFGVAEARHTLPGVMTDLSLLKPLEFLMVDDFRADFQIYDWNTNQLCELWGLAILDVATRKVLCFRLIAKTERTDGTKVGVSRRDMMHLIADYLTIYGYPKDYAQTWIVENASAAITDAMEETLRLISGGSIQVKRSSMFHGKALLAGFSDEGRGNPHGKGPIEAMWRLTWNDICNTAGYIGADYSLKPAESASRFKHVAGLIKAGQSLGMERAELEEFTQGIIPSFEDAMALLAAVWQRHGDREDHKLRGFDSVRLWRYMGTAEWRNVDQYPLPQMPADIFKQNVETLQRPETPNERLQRLLALHGFNRHILTPDDLWLILQDKAVIKYEGAMSFKVTRKIEGRSQDRFFNPIAFETSLVPGNKYLLIFDADKLDFVNVLSADGARFLGTAPRRQHADPRDLAALERSFKESEQGFQAVVKAVKTRQPIEDLTKRQSVLDHATAKFKQLANLPSIDAPQDAKKEGLSRLAKASRKNAAAAAKQIDFQAIATARLMAENDGEE
jgi:hypothetical protein